MRQRYGFAARCEDAASPFRNCCSKNYGAPPFRAGSTHGFAACCEDVALPFRNWS
jgi:hypothetical protein